MIYFGQIIGYRQQGSGTDLLLHLDDDIRSMIERQLIDQAEVILRDGRTITTDQRKKAYATIRDISDYTGDSPEASKEWMKYLYIQNTGEKYFSLSDCDVTTARSFITFLLDFCMQQDIPLTDPGLVRTDDISAYLVSCIRRRKCCICGKPADIHHIDAVGMGRDRRKIDDSQHHVIALCREHHNMCHNLGSTRFCERYHVYGIKQFQTEEPRDSVDWSW